MKIEIHWIRHGLTESNEQKRYLGRTDEPLSENGKRRLLEQKREKLHADLIFTSPMRRCMESAQVLFPEWEKRWIYQIAAWREIDFGAFEGKNYRELAGDPRYQAWIDSGGQLAFPEGESRRAFIERCLRGWEEMKRETRSYMQEHDKETLQIINLVHGGTIMAVLSTLTGQSYYEFQAKNGCGYRTDFTLAGIDGSWILDRCVPDPDHPRGGEA